MKKKMMVILIVVFALAVTTVGVLADKPVKFDPEGNEVGWEASLNSNEVACTTIQDGTLKTTAGDLITTGFDGWGYNYQAHMFNGLYCDSYRDAAWCQPYKDIDLIMKWNDAWISNVDCDGDEKLDRHYGFPSYIGSEAWLTNHQKGEYELDGQICKWEYFVKIVAAPADAYVAAPYDAQDNGTYYNSDGIEIGAQIWDAFAIIQQVENDACAGINGAQYISPDHPGFGGW